MYLGEKRVRRKPCERRQKKEGDRSKKKSLPEGSAPQTLAEQWEKNLEKKIGRSERKPTFSSARGKTDRTSMQSPVKVEGRTVGGEATSLRECKAGRGSIKTQSQSGGEGRKGLGLLKKLNRRSQDPKVYQQKGGKKKNRMKFSGVNQKA